MSPFLVRLADAVGPVVEIVHDVVACVRDVRHGSRDPALHDALLATRAELAGMAQRMDALVAGVERLQAAAGLDRPVVEGAPCATCGGMGSEGFEVVHALLVRRSQKGAGA